MGVKKSLRKLRDNSFLFVLMTSKPRMGLRLYYAQETVIVDGNSAVEDYKNSSGNTPMELRTGQTVSHHTTAQETCHLCCQLDREHSLCGSFHRI